VPIPLLSIGALLTLVAMPAQAGVTAARPAHQSINCAGGAITCTEVNEPEAFGEGTYVGHDEPSTLFYSHQAGSGNRNQWNLVLPRDPAPDGAPGRSYNFELRPAFWFGMAMCDTQSAPHPLAIHTCAADSDRNITSDANIANHSGTAFMEMQFYPPGWKEWPAGASCDGTKWCAALNIDSLSRDYPAGKDLNAACQAVTGLEYVNFAFITRTGVPQAPPNPVDSTLATFTPNPAVDLFMNSGDTIITTMKDTDHGLRIDINDATTGNSGFMVASAANGFGQVKFAPNPSTECTNIPYDFHPMYSTTSTETRVPWAAHSYNIAFSDEIGHFDFCTATAGNGRRCTGMEGVPGDQETADSEDRFCYNASESSLVPVTGCQATNGGFDGVPYKPLWPDGDTTNHPTPVMFSSPLTGPNYHQNYKQAALEADLPRIEAPDTASAGTCNRDTGAGCTLIPATDDPDGSGGFVPADFYPFFSITQPASGCLWLIGNDVPGVTANDFGKNAQYGSLLRLTYPAFGGGGATITRINDFRNIMGNPCPNEAGNR
jgi:hypothetical protein